MKITKLARAIVYLRNVGFALLSLPISLALVTGIIIVAVLALPIIWAYLILIWMNKFRNALVPGEKREVEKKIVEEEDNV
ncbi:MAG: hypothetical protein ACREBR_04950 [bacterium]